MEYGLHCDGSIWIQQCLLSLCSTYRLISNIIYKQNTLDRFSPLEASKVACQKNSPPSSGLFANRWRQWESNPRPFQCLWRALGSSAISPIQYNKFIS